MANRRLRRRRNDDEQLTLEEVATAISTMGYEDLMQMSGELALRASARSTITAADYAALLHEWSTDR